MQQWYSCIRTNSLPLVSLGDVQSTEQTLSDYYLLTTHKNTYVKTRILNYFYHSSPDLEGSRVARFGRDGEKCGIQSIR